MKISDHFHPDIFKTILLLVLLCMSGFNELIFSTDCKIPDLNIGSEGGILPEDSYPLAGEYVDWRYQTSIEEFCESLPYELKFGTSILPPEISILRQNGKISRRYYATFTTPSSSPFTESLIKSKLLHPIYGSGKYMITYPMGSFSMLCRGDINDVAESDSLILNTMTRACRENYPDSERGDSLRILDIGNSYSLNTTANVSQILKALDVDYSKIKLTVVQSSGATFRNWCDILLGKYANPYWIHELVNGNKRQRVTEYHPYDNSGIRSLLNDQDWDVILLHPASAIAPDLDLWDGSGEYGGLTEFMSYIKCVQPNAHLGLLLIHSYPQNHPLNKNKWTSYQRWRIIADNSRKVTDEYGFDIIVPYGTAVQNLRHAVDYTDLDLTSDYTHLQIGIPQFTASACYYQTLLAPYTHQSIINKESELLTIFDNGNDSEVLPADYTPVSADNIGAAINSAFLASRNMYTSISPDTVYWGDNPEQVYFNAKDLSYYYLIDSSTLTVPIYGEYPPLTIYNANGQLIGRNLDHNDYYNLPTGLYIVNGRKLFKY